MNVNLLGTGAADGIPAFYGDTRVSQYAREHGGKDVRTRAAALVDGIVKLDLGPDTWAQLARERLDARDWTALLITHSDYDHFALEELQYALYPFNNCEFVGFTIYGNAVICRQIIERYPDWPFEVVMTKSFCPIEFCDYQVTPVEANHKREEDAHNFLIDCCGKKLLYGTDTGVWFEQTWEFLKDHRLDCLVLECAEGFVSTPYSGHLDVHEVIDVVNRLRKQGTLDDKSVVVTTHHSHNGNGTHAELEAFLNPEGIQVGYDGMQIEI